MLDAANPLPERNTPTYKALLAKYADPDWRLVNLYYIHDDKGNRVRFVPNAGQRSFLAGMATRNVLPKARKIGFSTLIAVMITDRCVFRKGHVAGIVDYTIDDAQDKLSMIRFAYMNLPDHIRLGNPLTRDNDKYLEWKNGSSVSVGTSYRGGTPADLHVSEFGKTSTDNPEAAKEILTGAIHAVPVGGRIWVESTAHGTSGEFCAMVKRAQVLDEQKTPLTALDFKFQFYGWWIKEDYRLPSGMVTIPWELNDYFGEVEAKIGRVIDADQRAWYAKTLEQLGPDEIKEEFPSTADELFFVSIKGAFWRDEISRARRDERIGRPIPFDPSRGVNTFWDIGEDCTSIWFHQTDGVRHRFIDYWEEVGSSLQKACGVLDEKRRERGFVYRDHYGPHDLENKDWAHESKSRRQMALDLGVKFTVVPRIPIKADSIEAGRRLLNVSWFDAERTKLGVERLENYTRRWNKQMAQFTGEPLHDIASHGADAYQQGAMGLKPERVENIQRFRPKERVGSQWSR